jgi:uncharacterized phage protein (TIGR02220 family)
MSKNNKDLWAQAEKLVGGPELARRFRRWITALIKKELARRSETGAGGLFLKQAGEVIEDLNELTGRHYRLSQESLALIRARMSAGATVGDFKAVHRAMCARWLEDPKMRDYLRPSTLYRAGHFDEYLALYESPRGPQTTQINTKDRAEKQKAEREERDEIIAKLLSRPWDSFGTWREFMRWTSRFPDAESLALYEMPERIQRMRLAPLMLVKVLRGQSPDWAEEEYAQLKGERDEERE